jgi:hypothetical protein
MKNKILNAYKNKKLIGIYTDNINPDSFSVGYILHIDELSYILYEVSPYGKFDGYSCNLIEDIIKLEEDSIYLNNIKKLISYYNIEVNDILIDESKPIIFGFLDFIKSTKKICSILSYNSDVFDIVGFVKKTNQNSVEISRVNENSCKDGLVEINLDNIERIVCNSNAEVKLEILYNLNKK